MGEIGVVAADRAEGRDLHQRVVAVIDEGALPARPVGRAAIADPRVLRLGVEPLQPRLPAAIMPTTTEAARVACASTSRTSTKSSG
jgi:hypothetical protein